IFSLFLLLQTMAESFHISSSSSRITVYSQQENCTVVISPDASTLTLHTATATPINRIDLTLSDNDNNIIHDFKIPQSLGGRNGSVRIDALHPFVFEEGEAVRMHTGCQKTTCGEGLKNFALSVTPHFRNQLAPPTLSKICSTRLQFESSVMGVSSEALGVASPIFCARLYGNEKDQQIIKMKQVCRPFLHRFLSRNWNMNTVSTAISYLHFADRLMMLHTGRRLFQYIMRQPQHNLQPQSLHELIQFASKLTDNLDIVIWIIRQVPYLKCHEMLGSIMFSLSPATHKAVYAELGAMFVDERGKWKKEARRERKRGMDAVPGYTRHFPVDLYLQPIAADDEYDTPPTKSLMLYKYKSLNPNGHGRIDVRHLWAKVPEEYNFVKLEGRLMKRRENAEEYEITDPDVPLVANAYKNEEDIA
ncbi:hypothetical protein PFISCL1PPCAC_6244, partial [Pristionchus fissidentatus]